MKDKERDGFAFRAAVSGRMWKTVQVIVSAGLIIWLLTSIDCAAALDAARLVKGRILFAGFGLVLFAHVVSAARLHLILGFQNAHVGFRKTLRLTFAGLFAGNFLPGTIGGDAARIMGLTWTGLSKETALASIAMDRTMSVVAMLLLLPSALLAPRLLTSQERMGALVVLFLGIFLAVVFLVLVFLVGSKQEERFVRKSRTFWLWSLLQGSAYRFRLCLQVMKANPIPTVIAMGLSWAFFLLPTFAMWLLAGDLQIEADFMEMMGTVAITYFASLAPISLNGMGIQEGSLVLLLGHLGASPPQCLALAGIARSFHILSSLFGAWNPGALKEKKP